MKDRPEKRLFGSEDNPRPSPGFCDNTDDLIIFEQVRSMTNQSVFVRSDVELGTQPQTKIKIGDTWYKPLPESRVYWNLPGEPDSYRDDAYLFNANKSFIYDYLDVKEPGAYDVLAAFTLATWRFEDWSSYPYLAFIGHYGAGKSTAQRILKQICRRAVGGPSISVSSFVSMMDRFNATVFPDEAQIINSEDSPEMIAVLRGAYQKGNLRIKSVPTGHGWTDKAFNAYGFVAIASHDPLEEGIMQRCLSLSMVKRTRKLKKWRKTEFIAEGYNLRCWNLYYRFLHLNDQIPEEVEAELDEINDDRLQELALPLLTVSPPGPRESILAFFKILEKRKQVETESGEEADYFRALDFFTSDRGKDFIKPGGRILFSAFKQSLLNIKQEAEPGFKEEWIGGPKTVWKVLERLGFHHGGHTKEGSSVSFDASRVDALRPQYEPQTSLTPVTVTTVTTVTPIEKKVTEVTQMTVTGEKVDLARFGAKLYPGPLACPLGCGITFPDQGALDSHLSTYKHEVTIR